MATFSSAVKVGTRRNDWNTMPTASRRAGASGSWVSAVRWAPATSTRPEVARSSPPMIIIMLDLPAPEGPTTPTDSPAAISRPMPRRMLTSPAALASFSCTSLSWIIGANGFRRQANPTSARRTGQHMNDAVEPPDHGAPPRYARTSDRAYGMNRRVINLALLALACLAPATGRAERPLKLLALGDSLMAGYGLPS